MLAVLLFVIGAASQPSQAADSTRTVRVAGIVLKWIIKDRDLNYERAEGLIRDAAAQGAQIICTAESFLDGYSVRDAGLSPEEFRALAEPVPGGEYFTRLQKLCDTLNVYLVAALTELDSLNVYNSAVLIGPDGKLVGRYHKKFLWVDEEKLYTRGESFPVFATEYGNIGMMICSDRREPEAIKELAANGANLVFCPAGGGFGKANDDIVSQRSKEGKIPIVFVHPVEFLVTGPTGKILTTSLFGDQVDDDEESFIGGMVKLYDVPLPVAP